MRSDIIKEKFKNAIPQLIISLSTLFVSVFISPWIVSICTYFLKPNITNSKYFNDVITAITVVLAWLLLVIVSVIWGLRGRDWKLCKLYVVIKDENQEKISNKNIVFTNNEPQQISFLVDFRLNYKYRWAYIVLKCLHAYYTIDFYPAAFKAEIENKKSYGEYDNFQPRKSSGICIPFTKQKADQSHLLNISNISVIGIPLKFGYEKFEMRCSVKSNINIKVFNCMATIVVRLLCRCTEIDFRLRKEVKHAN